MSMYTNCAVYKLHPSLVRMRIRVAREVLSYKLLPSLYSVLKGIANPSSLIVLLLEN